MRTKDEVSNKDHPMWAPRADRFASAQVSEFGLAAEKRWSVSLPDYDALCAWSVPNPEQFWVSVWEGEGMEWEAV